MGFGPTMLLILASLVTSFVTFLLVSAAYAYKCTFQRLACESAERLLYEERCYVTMSKSTINDIGFRISLYETFLLVKGQRGVTHRLSLLVKYQDISQVELVPYTWGVRNAIRIISATDSSIGDFRVYSTSRAQTLKEQIEFLVKCARKEGN